MNETTTASYFDLPVYESMQQCYAQTGIPVAVMKTAKRAGCDAFSSSRIYLGKLLRWIFAQGDMEQGINWNEELAKEKAKREKIKRQREEKRTLDVDEVNFAVSKAVNLFFSEYDRLANVEGPPALKGLSERAIQDELISAGQRIKGALKSGLTTLANNGNGEEKAKKLE